MNSAGPWRTMQPRESLRIWLRRLGFNFFPAFRATGARVIYISEDMRKLLQCANASNPSLLLI